ncbi:hypothetical protein ACFY7Y_14435 [Streptomyces virginiae]|uniref:hypothetical protein n=1 Tax=Streptomyces virginiae TaxID=1961 RepID=UPI00368504A3
MIVTRIHHERGSYIEPACDANWPSLTRLQWKAAVVTHDTGLTVNVHEQTELGVYGVTVGSSTSGPYSHHELWLYLSGVTTGAKQACRTTA